VMMRCYHVARGRKAMRQSGVMGIALMLALSIGCGKSEEQKAAERAAEETKKAAEALATAAQKSAEVATKEGLSAAAKALEGFAGAMAGTGPDGKPVQAVSFQALQSTFPDVPGWQRAEPTGERMTTPISFSQAEVDYTKDKSRVEIKIVDSAFSQMLIAPWSMFLTSGYEKQTSSGHEKSVNVAGHPGFEKWNSRRNSGELNLVVNKRFLVTIEGNNIEDTKVLEEFATKLDAAKLAALK
jgi:hypothetical protein